MHVFGDLLAIWNVLFYNCMLCVHGGYMLEWYYAMAALPNQSRLRLFRGIVVTRSGAQLRSQGSLSYTHLRELFLSKLSQLGYDSKQFGLLSLRSGGASAAATAGVPDRLFKQHGR